MISSSQIRQSNHNIAMLALDDARLVIKQGFRGVWTLNNKAQGHKFDPVTEIDQNTEKVMRARLRSSGHGICGEEEGDEEGITPFYWLIDPIDGTRAFLTGMPTFMTLLALASEHKPLLGYADQPILEERFWGNIDESFLIKGNQSTKLQTRKTKILAQARAATTSPDLFTTPTQQAAFRALCAKTQMMRYGGDAYNYCMLAAGHIDIVVECGLQSYDILPLIPIIKGAGGTVLNWQGTEEFTGSVVAACNEHLAHETLEIMHKTTQAT